ARGRLTPERLCSTKNKPRQNWRKSRIRTGRRRGWPMPKIVPNQSATPRASFSTPAALRSNCAKLDDPRYFARSSWPWTSPRKGDFFETLLPGLGEATARGWKLFDRLPYQSRYDRKPFRAPGHANLLINRRTLWLQQLLLVAGPYQKDLPWLASWAPHIARYTGADGLGLLFAAAIDAGGPQGDEVFQILLASGRNEHEIGAMGRHVTTALLCAERTEGWQFVENMLLAAQRQEGLRQTILETIDEAHPQAFRRMLRLIMDHNLVRFSATVRALDVWLGYAWDAVGAGV